MEKKNWLYEMNGDQSSGRSRPSNEGVRGGLRSSTFWDGGGGGLKISGGGVGRGGAGPSPGSATAISLEILYVDLQGA